MRWVAALGLLAGCHLPWVQRECDCENRVVYGDGEITAVFRYADSGKIASYRETYADGRVKFAVERQYDARGRLVYQYENVDDAAPEDDVATWEYDDQGRIAKVVADFGDWRSESVYEYGRGNWIARRIDRGTSPDAVTYRYAADPLVIDELHDSGGDGTIEWGWRYTFLADRWLARTDDLGPDGELRADNRPVVYTYVDETSGRLARRDFSIGPEGPSEIDTYEWDGDRLVRATYDDARDETDQVIELEYDGDQLIRKHWSSPPQRFADTTTYEWDGDDIERIARRSDETGEVIESWRIERGCPGDRDMTVRIAPVNDWERALDTDGRGSDVRTMWGSHDVL